MALVAETGGADPARLRDVEDDPIRAAVLHLDVAAMSAALSHPERLVDVVAERRAGLCQLLVNGLEAVDLEADVVDATLALATLDPSHARSTCSPSPAPSARRAPRSSSGRASAVAAPIRGSGSTSSSGPSASGPLCS